jgi:hypothetical protein
VLKRALLVLVDIKCAKLGTPEDVDLDNESNWVSNLRLRIEVVIVSAQYRILFIVGCLPVRKASATLKSHPWRPRSSVLMYSSHVSHV